MKSSFPQYSFRGYSWELKYNLMFLEWQNHWRAACGRSQTRACRFALQILGDYCAFWKPTLPVPDREVPSKLEDGKEGMTNVCHAEESDNFRMKNALSLPIWQFWSSQLHIGSESASFLCLLLLWLIPEKQIQCNTANTPLVVYSQR